MFAKFFLTLCCCCGLVSLANGQRRPLPLVEVREAPAVILPGGSVGTGALLSIDCNSPVEWDSAGNLFLFTSSQHPYRTSGANLYELEWPANPVTLFPRADVRGGIWLEATYRAGDGKLYGWYHNEPPGICGSSSRLTAPRIGALVSYDDGLSWQNLGIVLEAPTGTLNCGTQNYYFAGGNGDFSVLLDQSTQYFYFFFSTYHQQVAEQGVAVARLRFEDRDAPVGKVVKWHNGGWNEPGLGGRVTVTIPVQVDWHRANANAYWGAAVHYNTYLESHVMLLNHAIDKNWTQEGIYISFNDDLSNPLGWSAPQRLPLSGKTDWYPQVIGTEGGETDKLASQVARFFMSGRSLWQLVFHRTDNEEPGPVSIPTRPDLPERRDIIRNALPPLPVAEIPVEPAKRRRPLQ